MVLTCIVFPAVYLFVTLCVFSDCCNESDALDCAKAMSPRRTLFAVGLSVFVEFLKVC